MFNLTAYTIYAAWKDPRPIRIGVLAQTPVSACDPADLPGIIVIAHHSTNSVFHPVMSVVGAVAEAVIVNSLRAATARVTVPLRATQAAAPPWNVHEIPGPARYFSMGG